MKSYRAKPAISESANQALKEYPDLTRRLLFHRGIDTAEKASIFLNPDYEKHLHDPYLLSDMDKAVKRVLVAIEKQEKIVVFSDYDADGIPGAVIMNDFFKKIGYKNFEIYIPHRHDEGFGLNHEAIESFVKAGSKLLITLDCGIADLAEVSRASELGLDVIITDHHMPTQQDSRDVLPAAYAVINPKRTDCAYPEKMLCGSGVAFKFIQALIIQSPAEWQIKEGWEKWLLDMVGLATLSDMVPLLGENRALAHYGLKVLRKSPRLGLMKLLAKLKTAQQSLTEDDIGFTISPRINAASRMGVPQDAFRLLSTDDEAEADRLSSHLNTINDERKGIVAGMVKELRQTLIARIADGFYGPIGEKPKVIVLGNPKWRPSLLGLAANTLMQEYQCPVFLWGEDGDELLKGSCRSFEDMDLQELLAAVPAGILTAFGGHTLAGGFAVSRESVHLLERELLAAQLATQAKKLSAEITVTEEILVDSVLSFDDVNWQTYGSLEKLAPFGTGNPKPIFLFERARIDEVRSFGKEKNHLELVFRNTAGKKVSAIGFFSSPDDWKKKNGRDLRAGEQISLIAHLEKSVFRNFPELRLRIVDLV